MVRGSFVIWFMENINWFSFPATDVNFIKCLLHSRDPKKLQEAEKLIRDVMESGTEEDTGELLHLEMINKLLLGKSDIEAGLKELKSIDQAWWARTIIYQKR